MKATVRPQSISAANERIKTRYYLFLKEAKRLNDSTINAAADALDQFETFTRRKDFARFHVEQAIAFKEYLASRRSSSSRQPLAKATILHTLSALRAFFIWLADQPGFRSRIRYSDAAYFNLSLKETAIAKARHDVAGPTIEQVNRVLAVMPNGTDLERRDRALVAFTLLTGARDNATASMLIKHIDLADGKVIQDAREVRTKASKLIITYFFPVGGDARLIVEEWVNFLLRERFWGMEDPLFPSTQMELTRDGRFAAAGLKRACWSTATPIRAIFRQAFATAGLPYHNPHSLRNTLVRLGETRCTTPEQFKSWSQNLGHEDVLTTFTSYGQVALHRQKEIIGNLGQQETAVGGSKDQTTLDQIRALLGDGSVNKFARP